ncbi:WD40-repeat-containing domain protein [Cladochytrium replicatum]|nr:WD40-repeat-containing domain protein [Cladochytrium replicatum]
MPLQLRAELTGHTETVWQVSWSPTSHTLASCSTDKTIRLWKPSRPDDPTGSIWTCVGVIPDAHKRTIRSVAFSPDGKQIASASFDGITAIWEFGEDGEFECIATLEGHENEVKSVSWAANGTLLATSSRDKTVWVWEITGDSEFEILEVLGEHTQDVKHVQWHPTDELLASCSYDDTIKLWMENGQDDWACAGTMEGHTSTVWSVDFDQTGNYLASVSDDKSIKIWRRPPDWTRDVVGRGRKIGWPCVHTIPAAHNRSIYSVSWSKFNDLIATAGGDNTINVFRVSKPDGDDQQVHMAIECAQQKAHGEMDINCVRWFNGSVNSTAYHNLIATGGDDGVIRIWEYTLA